MIAVQDTSCVLFIFSLEIERYAERKAKIKQAFDSIWLAIKSPTGPSKISLMDSSTTVNHDHL